MFMKMKFKQGLATVLVLLISLVTLAQQITVKGKVTGRSDGQPLSGASVQVKGGGVATTTGADGSFTLTVPGPGTVIVVTYVGFSSQELTVPASGDMNFSLTESAATTLTDVVVVGYGTQRVTKVSGAISTIKSGDIEKLRPVRTEEALQGRAAGVNVIQGGSPGSKPTVLIRGIPSFSGTDPVVIVDGVPQTLTDLNSINASDIESISVLKDAATTAIYGVKGGNGVIVVTTKSGRRTTKPDISISSNYGVQEVMNYIGVLNASEYAAMINEGSTVSGGDIIFPDLSALGVGTNWQKEIFETAPMQSHNISVRGGGDRMSYFLSGGFLSQGGIVGGYDKSRFNRGNLTANLQFDLSKKLKFIMNTSGVLLDGKGIQENSFNSVIGSALNFDPTVPVLNTVPNTVGKYGFSNLLLSEIFNP
ncbi:MAG: SusC/RagA family TonB-linked outer membrane protein, partial [Sphingobacteriales bacterium 12-47-4]